MGTRFLGKTGLRVSALCLGAMTLGREAGETESRAISTALLRQAVSTEVSP